MENNIWLKLLNDVGISTNDKYHQSIEVINVEVDNDSSKYTLSLKLKVVVPAEFLTDILKKVATYLKTVAQVKEVNYRCFLEKKHCPKGLLIDYFQFAVSESLKHSLTVKTLEHYRKDFSDNRIVIYVANEEEKNLVNDAIFTILSWLAAFDLDFIEVDVVVSKMENDVVKEAEKKYQLLEKQIDNRSYEQQAIGIQERAIKREVKTNKMKRASGAIAIALNELPVESYQVSEFVQKRGTDVVLVSGEIIKAEIKKVGNYNIFIGIITDQTDSITVKQFLNEQRDKGSMTFFQKEMLVGRIVQVKGRVNYDSFSRDVVIMSSEVTVLGEKPKQSRNDLSSTKRVELHAHTQMSTLDGILKIEDYVETAKAFGHQSVAVTDHGNCHALPDLFNQCKKHGIKPIAGLEAYFIDDKRFRVTLTENDDIDLINATYVVMDVETTGFSALYHEIIEIGAVKIKNGLPVGQFSSFIKPRESITNVITNVTGITDDDVANAPTIDEVMPRFLEFIEGAVLVAHNANFDMGFLYNNMRNLGLYEHDFPCIDTMLLAMVLYNDTLKRYNLKDVAKGLKVELYEQHRALSDSRTTANVFTKMLGDLSDLRVYNYRDINKKIDPDVLAKLLIPTHVNLLVKNKTGLKNLYKIVSDSHTIHFNKDPRLLKSFLDQHRDGLLVGSGCCNGEVFKAAYEKGQDELERVMAYYDYVEVQPLECYEHLVDASGDPKTAEYIEEVVVNIIRTAQKLNKTVVATGDVHELEPTDYHYRSIYCRTPRPGGGMHELSRAKQAPRMYFRTTQEMLDAFGFIGLEDAYKIVVENTNAISDMIETYELFSQKLFAPHDDFLAPRGVPSMAKAVENIAYQKAREMYGEQLPEYVEERLKKELNSIISNDFASIYYFSYLLVAESNKNNYIVGSRGSVGSSFVATMMNITEVNPLKPHYYCPICRFTAFKGESDKTLPTAIVDNLAQVNVGQDLPHCLCPTCGSALKTDGVDIPFETFLGFKGDKTPDIDLNFSGEYQEKAHLFCQELFGYENAFRAGTISTVANKTAFGFVDKHFENSGVLMRSAEKERIATALEGTKRTTGQHPGGIVVIPSYMEYTDIIPIQYPADAVSASWRTTHFDYHKFEKNLLKLDILGHDDPTMIKILMDYVRSEPENFPFSKVEEIPLCDPAVLSLFSSRDALNMMAEDEIDDFKSGTIGIPEFGTSFVRGMLDDIKPQTFDEIVKVSGLSHGTGVWLRNARDLLLGGVDWVKQTVPFSEIISCRDDMLVKLVTYNIPPYDAFNIMETVRKGIKLSNDQQSIMREHGVPEWYIQSCLRIEYMFPKAHAAAYVIMALRIGWFKVYRPLYYYAAYFSCRATAFDVEAMVAGRNALRNRLNNIKDAIDRRKEVSNKEKDILEDMRIALEMTLRGYRFNAVSITKSEARRFVIGEDGKSLFIPFAAVENLGEAAANSIVEARNQKPFISKKDVELRTKLNKTTYTRLRVMGTFDELPDEESGTLL